jgi:hypothetical protein
MGTWGPNLYQDDLAEEVRDYYIDQLRKGKSGKAITQELINGNKLLLSDKDEAPVFWFALADVQWSYGRLEDFVKENALHHIHEGSDVLRWQSENLKMSKIRENVLLKLEQKLLSQQPVEKKIKPLNLYQCTWKVGDVFSYELNSELVGDSGIKGKYLIIRKVDEYNWHPGHIIPIVHVKISNGEEIPTSGDEYNSLEYVQVSNTVFSPYGGEFHIDSKGITNEEFDQRINEIKAKLTFDEYGYLPKYQLKLIITSKRTLPKNLVYLGNFSGVVPPKTEFIPRDKISISSSKMKDLAEYIVRVYCSLNLRRAPIYHK